MKARITRINAVLTALSLKTVKSASSAFIKNIESINPIINF